MKVFLGPYRYRWVSYVHERWMDRKYTKLWWDMDESEFTAMDKLMEKLENILQTIYNKTINKILDNQERKIDIRVHGYDVWGADNTIARLVHPLLIKLKEVQHGCPWTDDEDVPDEFKSTNAEPKENEWDTDSNLEKRWDYILNEMIWAFDAIIKEEDGDDPFMEFEDDPNAQFGIRITRNDREGREAHNARIANGLRLFGKYFRSLWD